MSSFSSGLGRHIARDTVSLKASGSETETTVGSTVELGDKATLNLELVVGTVTGTTPTLDVIVQGSNDGTNWYTLLTFTQATGTITERLACPAARYVRYSSTIGGTTPDFDYALTGTAV